VIVITPAQLHMHIHVLLRAGFLAIITVGEPGVQGAGIMGTHGIGVNTPIAALVAAATCGLARLWHMPKGIIFFMGMLSMMVAAGFPSTRTLFSGVTMRLLGATPKLHVHMAPIVTI
jgi:hypothetical protein